MADEKDGYKFGEKLGDNMLFPKTIYSQFIPGQFEEETNKFYPNQDEQHEKRHFDSGLRRKVIY